MLRGPDPEAFRIKQWGARYYVDPLPSCDIAPATKDKYPAVSTIKKAWSKPFRKKLPTGETVPLDALWAAEYIADNLPAVNLLANDRAAVVQLCALAPGRRLNAAADRGTGVHSFLERLAEGGDTDDMLLPADVEPYADACRAFVKDWAPVWVASEFICFNREVGYAGTADALITMEIDGQPQTLLVDWKTRSGAHGAYEEEIAQIGGYSLADYIVVIGSSGRPKRMELPGLDGGLIVSLGTDGYQPYPVEIDDAREAFLRLHDSWVGHRYGQKAARRARQHPLLVPPSDAELELQLEESLLAVSDSAGVASPTGDDDTASTPERWERLPANRLDLSEFATPAAGEDESPFGSGCCHECDAGEPCSVLHAQRLEWLQKRIDAIKARGDEAKAALAREWSTQDSIPTMPNGGPRTPEEFEVVSGWCWTVEGALGISFPDPEPGSEAFIARLKEEGMVS